MDLTALRVPGLPERFFRNLLLVSVYGFALSLLLGRGTYKPSLYLCLFAATGCLLCGRNRFGPDRPLLIVLGFGLAFLLQGWIMADRPISGAFQWAILSSLLVAAAVTWLPDRFGGRWRLTHGTASTAVLVLFVAAQGVAYRWPVNKAGLFSNVHYLALYTVITLPALYFFVLETGTAARWLLVLALAGDFWLLLKTQSRPGFLALLAASLAAIPYLSKRHRLIAASAIVLVPAALYFTGLLGFADRVNDLVANFAREERPVIWRETLELQSRSTMAQWWFGHGLGQFHWDYQAISSFHSRREDYYSPHNFLLDLLYSHGIAGLISFLLAYGLLFGKLAAVTSQSRERSGKAVGMLLISMSTAHLVHGFLTMPFFSRHNLHPLSLILGACLRYFRENDRHA